MYRKQIIVKGDEARAKLMKGADFVAESVKLTLGPYGQNWILPNVKKVSNDGLAVAMENRLDDEIENEGAKAIQRIMQNIADRVGDATSTGACVSQAILKESSKLLGNRDKGIIAKMSTQDVKQKLLKEYAIVAEKLTAMATQVTSREQLIESAMVSVENKELAELIGGVQWDLGKDGIILAETTNKPETTIERVSGFRVENSVATTIIVNNMEKGTLDLDDVHIILTNHNITSIEPLMALIENLNKMRVKKVVLMGRMFSNEAVQKCLQNIASGGVQIYPLNAPFGNQVEMLKDIAAVTGGAVCLDEEKNLEDILVTDVGFATHVSAGQNSSIFTTTKNPEIEKRIVLLEQKLAAGGSSSAYDRAKLEARIAQLKGGFAILKIGSLSTDEKSYKKDKVDDAVNAVRLALQEGVVAGAGLALVEIADSLPDDSLLKTPLKSVHKWITESAPTDFKIEPWVKDPAKVLRVAIEESCIGIASLVTSGGVAVFENERKVCNCGNQQ